MKSSNCAAIMLTLLLLVPTGLEPQIMPPQPGKLNIYSQPAGAAVTINGQQQEQRTNAAFVVSPGTYQVSVAGSNPPFSCPAKSVHVDPNQTVTLYCKSTTGWQQ
jgi:hypothetical protein